MFYKIHNIPVLKVRSEISQRNVVFTYLLNEECVYFYALN